MKASVNISLKTIFLALGIIVVVVLGYVTVKILFSGPSVAGRTFVSIPTAANQKIESMSFTKEGLMLEAEYSQVTGKWKDNPFAGKYEISGDRLILTALGGVNIIVTPIKWFGNNKYQLIHNSDTITYVLRGSEEDPSLINTSYESITGISSINISYSGLEDVRFECSTGIAEEPYIAMKFCFGYMFESIYSTETEIFEPQLNDAYAIQGDIIVKFDKLTNKELNSYKIIWLNKDKFMLFTNGKSLTFIRKEAPVLNESQRKQFGKIRDEINEVLKNN